MPSFGDDSVLFVRISIPVSVARSVCSNCAEGEPSRETAVQPSGHKTSAPLPRLSMGSIVKTCPGLIVPTCIHKCIFRRRA